MMCSKLCDILRMNPRSAESDRNALDLGFSSSLLVHFEFLLPGIEDMIGKD